MNGALEDPSFKSGTIFSARRRSEISMHNDHTYSQLWKQEPAHLITSLHFSFWLKQIPAGSLILSPP